MYDYGYFLTFYAVIVKQFLFYIIHKGLFSPYAYAPVT